MQRAALPISNLIHVNPNVASVIEASGGFTSEAGGSVTSGAQLPPWAVARTSSPLPQAYSGQEGLTCGVSAFAFQVRGMACAFTCVCLSYRSKLR